MKIPVFVSCPTVLSSSRESARKLILKHLERLGMEARALGRSDYPTELPLREVLIIGRHCSGALILGFEHFQSNGGIWKRDTSDTRNTSEPTPFPTPWNNLEAGILFGLGLPMLVFRENGITGGIFDPGVSDVFIHAMPVPSMSPANRSALEEVFLKWAARVREHYYR